VKKTLVTGALCVVLAAGCYKTQINLGAGPGTRSGVVDNNMHLNLLNIVELSSPVDLVAACPGSQAVAIDERLSVLGGIVNIVLGRFIPILSVMNPSVDCAGGGMPGGGMPGGDSPGDDTPPEGGEGGEDG
jgi:hypothetical protein